MPLKDFIGLYGDCCSNDIELIMRWSYFNGNQGELISAMANVAASLVYQKEKNEKRVAEWAGYAMSSFPQVDIDTPFETAMNILRIGSLAYNGRTFVDFADRIMESSCLDWELIENLHPEIADKYIENRSNKRE